MLERVLNLKDLLREVNIFRNDEYVNQGLYEDLQEEKWKYDDKAQAFIDRIDEDDFVENVIIDLKEAINWKN